jgi:hypothetical protein
MKKSEIALTLAASVVFGGACLWVAIYLIDHYAF